MGQVHRQTLLARGDLSHLLLSLALDRLQELVQLALLDLVHLVLFRLPVHELRHLGQFPSPDLLAH